MNEMLQQFMNMIENTRSIPTMTDISMIGFGVLLVFGVINCILGYRLLRFWMMLCGFIIGAGVGFGVAYSSGVTEKYMYAVIMVGIGVVLAVIAFVSYKIGIFILGAGIGIGLGIYIFHPTSSLVFFFCLLLGAGLGVLAMRQAREILIVGTSLLGGAMAGVSAAKLGGLADFPYGLGMSAGFAILGMLIQFATNRRKRDEDDAAEDEDEFYEEAENSSDYVDPKEGNFTLTESVAVLDKGKDDNSKLAMKMAECIIKKGRSKLIKNYPVPIYKGEKEDKEQKSGNPKTYKEKLTLDLLKQHQQLSENAMGE